MGVVSPASGFLMAVRCPDDAAAVPGWVVMWYFAIRANPELVIACIVFLGVIPAMKDLKKALL